MSNDNKKANTGILKTKIFIISLTTICVALIIIFLLVFLVSFSGRLAVVVKQPNQAVLLRSTVCDTNIVDKFNSDSSKYYQLSGGSSNLVINKQPIKDLVADIKSKSNFENDPTCQAIIFWAAVQDDNYKSAKSAYDQLTSLHNRRIFADSNLRGAQPLFTYKDTLKGLTGSGSSNNGTFGG
jgi:hypothetical protein